MGCGASTAEAPAAPTEKRSGAVSLAEATGSDRVTTSDCSEQAAAVLERVLTFGSGVRESPIITSTNVKKLRENERTDDRIMTILTEDADEEPSPKKQPPAELLHPPGPPLLPLTPVQEVEQQQQQQEEDLASALDESPVPRHSQKPPDALHGTRTMHASLLSCDSSSEFERLAPPGLSGEKSPRCMLPLQLPPLAPLPSAPVPAPANRYDDITLSDDDDDDGDAHGFDLGRWHRYYKWNKSKPADLLEFLWRRFDPKHHSMYCATYKAQDMMFAAYQGDNVVHGLCCRLEALRIDLFGILHTLYNPESGVCKVLGVFIFEGTEVPKAFMALPDYEFFQMLKADTKDPTVRRFLSKMLTCCSPVPEFSIAFTQEFPPPKSNSRTRE